MDTVVLPTPPTSGAIVTGSGYNRDYDGLAELITNNNVADNGRAILTAIANGDAAIIAADQAGHLSNQKATMDGSVAGINSTNLNGVANLNATNLNGTAALKAIYDAQVAGINQTNLGTVSTTKAVTDNGLANLTSTERNAGEVRMNLAKESGEARLQTAIASGEIRELINTTATTNLLAIKDNLHAIDKEGCKTREVVFTESCKTREQEADHFAKLQYQAEKNKNDIEKEMLKGFHQTQLEALKNKCDLEKQIAEICCCVEKDGNVTRGLIAAETAARQAAQIQRQEMEILILKNRHEHGGK